MSDRVSKTERLAKECETWRDSIRTLAELNKLSFVRIEGGILVTRHNQEIAPWSPDPFPRDRVGSGHETRGPTAHSSENRYEWVLIHETWPVQKVQSKNAVSSSDCTTALYSSSHECVHGRYTGSSREPYVIVVSTIAST